LARATASRQGIDMEGERQGPPPAERPVSQRVRKQHDAGNIQQPARRHAHIADRSATAPRHEACNQTTLTARKFRPTPAIDLKMPRE